MSEIEEIKRLRKQVDDFQQTLALILHSAGGYVIVRRSHLEEMGGKIAVMQRTTDPETGAVTFSVSPIEMDQQP